MENNVKENKALTREEKAIARENAAKMKKMAKKRTKIQESLGDKILLGFTDVVLVLVLIIVGYPVLYVISCSFSSNSALTTGRVLLFPVDFSLASYEFVFQYDVVWQGYRNTIFYTIVGVILTVFMEIITAYPLSKPEMPFRRATMLFFVIVMLFTGGMAPNILLMNILTPYIDRLTRHKVFASGGVRA